MNANSEVLFSQSNMTVIIDSRFATARETADVLGVSSQRVKQLAKLVDASMKAQRANGISGTAPTAGRKQYVMARAGIAKRKSKIFANKSSVDFPETRPSKKSKAPRRKPRRGKKSKTAR
jgi:hypothetical protein